MDIRVMLWLMRNPTKGVSVEYADNRIAIYSAQKEKCEVTGTELRIGYVHCHYIKPKSGGGTDNYKNLILITETVHKLIHATKEETIQRYLEVINPNAKQLLKINELRKETGLKSLA